MSNLKNHVSRNVVFKPNVENKAIKFRPSLETSTYLDAIIKMVMNDIVTIVYTEDHEVKERTYTCYECYDYFKFEEYGSRQAETVYSTTLKPGDVFYIDCTRWKGKAIYRTKESNMIKFMVVEKDADYNHCQVDINDIISGKATGEVWDYEP